MTLPIDTCAILIVEDDADLAYLLRHVLQALGLKNLTFVTNGRAALAKVLERPFDIIISDWEMRPMSGIDFIRSLRTQVPAPNRYTPVIMVTGRTAVEDVILARDAGITEFVAKPFSTSDLCARMLAVVKNQRHFVVAGDFTGPDRRRKHRLPPDGKLKREEDGA